MKAVNIDGKTLEGGGQLVRIILGLSALTRKPVYITNIRANRRSPKTGRGGGLKRQHLTAATWLAKVCGATTEGLGLSSSELLFQPLPSLPALDETAKMMKLPDGRLARSIFISLESQGAMALLLQAILPYMLLSGASDPAIPDMTPIHLTLEGGTHVTSSPTLSYVDEVLIPNLNLMFGNDKPLIETSGSESFHYGWNFGARTFGKASFVINPLPYGSSLPSFALKPKGSLRCLRLTLFAPDTGLDELRLYALLVICREIWDVEEVVVTKAEESGQRQRYYILLVAETEHGSRIGSDCLWSGSTGRGANNLTIIVREMVHRVVQDFKRELSTGLPMDHYMLDQVAVFMGLAKGVSSLTGDGVAAPTRSSEALPEDRKASLHTETARWAVHKLVGAHFEADGTTHGVGFEAGTQKWTPAEVPGSMPEDHDAVEASLDALHITDSKQ